MKSNDLLVLLGNQLFPISEIKRINPNQIFMAEDYDLCTYCLLYTSDAADE